MWGCNRRGQLAEKVFSPETGDGKDMELTPKQIDPSVFGDRRVTDIYSGWTHMLAVLGKCFVLLNLTHIRAHSGVVSQGTGFLIDRPGPCFTKN